MRLRDGKAKVLTLSYDGNNVYDEKLIEILDKNGIKETSYDINSGTFRYDERNDGIRTGKTRLTLSDAKRIYTGITCEFAVHTYTLRLQCSGNAIYLMMRLPIKQR